MISFYLSIVQDEEDKDKVTFIYENYYSFMAYIAGKYLKNKYDIEDVVHSSMIKIIDHLDIIDMSDKKRAKNLCGVVARNKAIDFCRLKENQNVSMDEIVIEDETEENTPHDIIVSKDTYNVILETIKSLDDTYRDVCLLKYVNGLKEQEIALLLDLSPKTVSLRIYRGKQILRNALRKENIYV